MKPPIRILQVFSEMNRGGSETMIMDLYRNIDRSKVQFDFVVHTNVDCDFDSEIRSLGGKIYRLPKYNGFNHLLYVRKWKQFFQENTNYHIIHGHVRSTASIYLAISKQFGLHTISHSHSTSNGKGFSAFIKNIMQTRIKYIADFFMAPSVEAGQWLFGNEVINSDSFIVLKNAINLNNYTYDSVVRKQYRAKLDLLDKFVIGHVGNFKKEKNHEFILKVFEKVSKKEKNARLILVGSGEMKDEIQNLIIKLNIEDKVYLLGKRADVPELMQAFDLFIFPSLFEGLGIAVIEAQASGLTVLSSEEIPDVAAVTPLLKKISLKLGPEEWARIISASYLDKTRLDTSKEIYKAGYDIKSTAKIIEKIYLENT